MSNITRIGGDDTFVSNVISDLSKAHAAGEVDVAFVCWSTPDGNVFWSHSKASMFEAIGILEIAKTDMITGVEK